MTDDSIVFRTGAGTQASARPELARLLRVDEIDPATQSGWSVLAVDCG